MEVFAMKRFLIIVVSVVFILASVSGAIAAKYSNKRILFIDSYHQGYAWSDGITDGVKAALKGSGVELKVIRMDTKRNKETAFKEQAALKAKSVIERYKPHVVIASDDNASKFLIVPYFKDNGLPFVFCGVNWDASVYGFPASNVTGMVEVNDVMGLVKQLKQFAKGDRIGFIAGDTLTNRKEVENYKKTFNLNVVPYYASDFEDWKKGFVQIQKKVDVLIVYNFVAIEGWNKAEAENFAIRNTRVPTGTMQEGPMPYAMIGFLKLPQEQGMWAANTALKILDGTSPDAIPVVHNKEGKLMINMKIAQGMGVDVPYEIIESADALIE
jgi:ABC-type uncharacterized transport system substrate-binding protein